MGGMQNGSRICKIQIRRGGRGSEQMSDLVGGCLMFPLHIHVLSAQQRSQAKPNSSRRKSGLLFINLHFS